MKVLVNHRAGGHWDNDDVGGSAGVEGHMCTGGR
jgi:hypothetical protein